MDGQDRRSAEPNDSVREWIRANAMALRSMDPQDEDWSDLHPLGDLIGDARVVCIGESHHLVHEFYQLKHRLLRFLVSELGFSAFVMESGFTEGLAVNEWVLGGPAKLRDVLRTGITYFMGFCEEMQDHLEWMRAWNSTEDRKVRFYGMDLPSSQASVRPAVEAALAFLNSVKAKAGARMRTRFAPFLGRVGLFGRVEAHEAYRSLRPEERQVLTALVAELVSELESIRDSYAAGSTSDGAELALRCAVNARQMDEHLLSAPWRPASGTRYIPRDVAMVENVAWILEREERIVIGASNAHVQRAPFAPSDSGWNAIMLGQRLAEMQHLQAFAIGTTFGSGRMLRPGRGELDLISEEIPPPDRPTMDALLDQAGLPAHLVNLRDVPTAGPVANAIRDASAIRIGPRTADVDIRSGFDAIVHISQIGPWRAFPDVVEAYRQFMPKTGTS